jgi:cyclophilin family peptidyl-prolyl cis-trans isomerase
MRSQPKILLAIVTLILIVGAVVGIVTFTNRNKDANVNGTSATSSASSTVLNYGTNSSMITAQQTDRSEILNLTTSPKTMAAEKIENVEVEVNTTKGKFTLVLDGGAAPKTVSNFVFLVENKFYDGLTFHRYVPNFVIQGGDPKGDGTGGPNYTVPAELSTGIKHEVGVVAMARKDVSVNPTKASSGSQFYITLAATPHLDNDYTTFGRVKGDGMQVVKNLREGDVIISMQIVQ